MIYPQLHFRGQVWRPPYKASSQLLQVTSGCTWHKCKFCSLYHGTPFRVSPLSEIEADLKVIRQWQPRARRVYLTGANPFALSYNKLMHVAILLRKYLPNLVSFGMFARVTDIAPKTVEELKNLRHMKLDSINIGIETAHDETLERMNKGYQAKDILEQLSKLDKARIRYNVFYLNGLGGKGNGLESAIATADILNQLHPCIINIVSLTIFPESELYHEVLDGTYEEEPEIERLIEMRTLIERLNIKVNILGHHISNTVPITGALPDDKVALLREFDKAIAEFPEVELKAYRNRIWHL
ncbi:MAG: radical SAM protein [Duncaniella sp.]|uniref:radical SAM protein n=1 Tax=Duncaniella sp. TaxID=2518496 RepID=UPI0023BBAB1C|nr:radical SAM protein [Duncaniella sp.]MDE6089984.1 radical SAM protein [Duncaniella sp.]